MAKLHLQITLTLSGFAYSTCGRFTKHHGRFQKLKEARDLNYIYNNELDIVSFAHDSACVDCTGLFWQIELVRLH